LEEVKDEVKETWKKEKGAASNAEVRDRGDGGASCGRLEGAK
jgi:hypothetical protein